MVKPVFVSEPTIRLENAGKMVIIYTLVTSQLEPKVTWLFAGKPVKDGGRYRMITVRDGDNYTIRFEITDAAKTDSGEYKCTISNEAGDIVKSVPLTFEGR